MSISHHGVSVIMAVHNAGRYLDTAVESILQQTHSDFDMVIVNDGSSDDSGAKLDVFAARDSRVLVVHQENRGPGATLQRCLDLAQGAIVVVIDHDDAARPERIARQLAYLEANPRIAVVGTAIGYIDGEGQPVGEVRYAAAPGEIVNALHAGQSPMAHPSVAMRREAVLAVGGYRAAFRYAEDFDLWHRLSERYDLANMPEVLLDYRVHDKNASKLHHFEQALSASIAMLAGAERRKGLPDPTSAITHLMLADIDRFDLSYEQRSTILCHLSEAALETYRVGRDPDHLVQSQRALAMLKGVPGPRARRIAVRLARAHALAGYRMGALTVMADHARAHVVGRSAVVRRAIGWGASSNASTAVRQWLVHLSDPQGPSGEPPSDELTPPLLKDLVTEAQAHAVLPAIMRHLPPSTVGESYAQVRSVAQGERRMMLSFAAMLKHHAEAIVAEMGSLPGGIVKGRSFARTIYPDPALRSYTDIDLLVAPSAVAPVEAILTRHGFKLLEDGHDPQRLEAKWMHTKNVALLVEVHTNMVHHPGLRRAMSLAYDDLEGALEAPGAQLAIATMHAALHQYERLQQVVDICQAARAIKTAAEEERFLRIATRSAGRLGAIVGLELAHRIYGEQRCDDLARALRPERFADVSRLLITPAVVSATKGVERSLYSWRRKAFRDLLKRNRGRRGDFTGTAGAS